MTNEEKMMIAICKEHQRNQAIEEATRFLNIQERSGFKVGVEWADAHPKDNIVDIDMICEQLTAFAVHLNKRGAFRDDLCMDFEHEAQSFIELQKKGE